MTSKRYLGNIITDTPTAPAGSYANNAASGVWSVAEASAYTKAGLWPIAGNFPLSPEDVFSTHLYEGNGSTQTITNGIDLSGEGGLVWTKDRDTAVYHALTDTERGGQYAVYSSASDAQVDRGSDFITSFSSDGYSVGADGLLNDTYSYVSWTFRKASKFFDVVTYTGDGTDGRTISHNLGTTVGSIFVKRLDATAGWYVYHRHYGGTHSLFLNATMAAAENTNYWNDTNATSTEFTVASNSGLNASGGTYVAYLFAHNDGDGNFGPTGDQDIIKCGSFTSTSGTDEIDLGFEPQWILIKRADAANSWVIVDELRGNPVGSAANYLEPNATNAESTLTGWTTPTPTGFTNSYPLAGGTFIYIAIRRGPMKVPTAGTNVFGMDFATSSGAWTALSGFPIDFLLYSNTTSDSDNYTFSRLSSPNYMRTNLTNAEAGYTVNFDRMDGIEFPTTTGDYSTWINWMWRRAPNFFDQVCYTGNGTERSISHNLGAVPEMIWVKQRSGTKEWFVYHKDLTSGKTVQLESTAAEANGDYGSITDTTFGVNGGANLNASSGTYIAYLFASLDGVSKLGSFTGNGTTVNVDCGFSSGARFVMTKRIDAGSDWVVWDTERGIVAGNDGYLVLNDVNAENSSYDSIDTYSSGFSLNYDGVATNISGASYIFYAIA